MDPRRKGSENPRNPFRDMYSRAEIRKRRGSFFGGIARFVLLVGIGCIAGGAGLAVQGYFFFTHGLPSIEKLKNYAPPTVTHVYADKGELIGEFATERRFVTPIDQIPKMLQNAFVAAEDKNFWQHTGVDKEAIVRAIKNRLQRTGWDQGASTITQQDAKTFFLTPEKKFIRKIKEQILATRMEQSLSKEYILYLYLNQIYLGSSAYGVEAAAHAYFDKSVKDLTIAECAMLAGLPQAPSKVNPKKNLKASLERRGYVLRRMLEDGYITEAEYEQANNEEPVIASRTNPYVNAAPDFVEHVRKYVERKYGADALNKEGLKIYTTANLDMTAAGQSAMDRGLRDLDKRQGYRGPMRTNVKDVPELESPLRFGQVANGVVTHVDGENIYVRLGTYTKNGKKKEYLGQMKIDPNPKWWVRTPFIRQELRTRTFAQGDLPFQVGDLIQVRVLDPNAKRRELYMKKFGKADPDMKNYKEYSEEMLPYFPVEPEQQPIVQSALMFRENRSGHVKAMLGGYSLSVSQYNRAVQAKRQAGSSFKPVIYAAALNKGFTCADIILDSPMALTVPGTGEVWRPKNYRGGFQGPMTFRDAIVKSRNIPTIKILQQIGIEHAKVYARRLGYTSPLVENLTMALGSTGVSLEEQVNAYAVFPNKGYYIPPIYVTKIVDRNGKVLEEHDPPVLLDDPTRGDLPQVQKVSHNPSQTSSYGDSEIPDKGAALARRRIDEATAYIMSTLLQGVVQDGTATILKKIVGRPEIAGKTGTTNDNIDAWFVGFSPDYSCGVWVGFDDEFSIGDQETGGHAAAPIWGYFMKEVLKDKPVKEYTPPQSIEHRRIDPRTGLVTASPDGLQEVFKAGSGPVQSEPKLIKGSRWDYPGSDLDQF
ncbi:MAG: PBP1A family penicillin-binding protein [Desulfomonile tiedjei]|nr:PBP1A family penicillin-binding protein [Desulfomonile tiedjei]